jgi:hypothetical protein
MRVQLQLMDEMSATQVTWTMTEEQLKVVRQLATMIPHHLQILTK